MLKNHNVRGVIVGLALGSLVFFAQRGFGREAGLWVGGALLFGLVVVTLARGTYVSRSGYWTERGFDSELGEPCWLVKGGPFVDPHDEETVVGELGTYWQARRYIARNERLMTLAMREQGPRG